METQGFKGGGKSLFVCLSVHLSIHICPGSVPVVLSVLSVPFLVPKFDHASDPVCPSLSVRPSVPSPSCPIRLSLHLPLCPPCP